MNIFEKILDKYLQNNNSFFFIQVGANDGIMWDPLHPFIQKYPHLNKGILIEPQKKEFDNLKKNYTDKEEFIFENIAIHKNNCFQNLYKVKSSLMRNNHDAKKGWATLNKKRGPIGKKLNPEDIETEKVKCVTFESLLNKYNVTKLDLLQIDTEGHDFEIIKLFDFNKVMPRIINYETQHLTKHERKTAKLFLKNLGYHIYSYSEKDVANSVATLNIKEF